ncbi:retrovirus-related pol polyprotein from transposon TNT 1-94 [Tanacetum coccineum]|uniref:Retrovirus-related pol polyprotein from transposon TNT 1-94 n=1 Tax=Tanacetum coccineum TaxID=301880 RepID=A0ABQ5GX53_9ASTR
MMLSSPIYLLSKASKTKSWIWHRMLSHLDFDSITALAKKGLLRTPFKKISIYCTWPLRANEDSKHQWAKIHIVRLNAIVQNIITDNGTEFVNPTLRAYYEYVGISHQTSVARSSQQNGIVKRRNRTLVEVARTMLIFSKASLFLWGRGRLVPNPPFPTTYVPPTKKDLDTLFELMFDEYLNPPTSVVSPIYAVATPRPTDLTSTHFSTTINQDAPSPSTSQTPQETQSLVIPSGVEEHFHDIEVAHLDNDPFFGVPIPEPNSEEYSSRDVILTNVHSVNQPLEHLRKWTKDHPMDNVIGSPSRPVSTRH